MKKSIAAALILCFAILLIGCSTGTKQQSQKNTMTPLPRDTSPQSGNNPISGPIQNSNHESALSDARNCLSVLVMSLAEEGVGTLDNGIVFVVEKEGTEYIFVYSDGDLTENANATKGVEITPDSSDWLTNVRAYMP